MDATEFRRLEASWAVFQCPSQKPGGVDPVVYLQRMGALMVAMERVIGAARIQEDPQATGLAS